MTPLSATLLVAARSSTISGGTKFYNPVGHCRSCSIVGPEGNTKARTLHARLGSDLVAAAVAAFQKAEAGCNTYLRNTGHCVDNKSCRNSENRENSRHRRNSP